MDYVNEIFTDFHELHGDRTLRTTSPSSAAWPASTARPAW
jgi:acetyl-CoA carboxylase alpha subunit